MPTNDLLADHALQRARVNRQRRQIRFLTRNMPYMTTAQWLQLYTCTLRLIAEVDADVQEIQRQLDVVRRVRVGFCSLDHSSKSL